MPTKRLPGRPDIEQLKYQARDLLKACAAGDRQAAQRIREFHPRFSTFTDEAIVSASFRLSDAQLTIAREYGYSTWPRLGSAVRARDRAKQDLPHHDRIDDVVFRQAVALLDDGDADGLRKHLEQHPHVVTARVSFEGENYFRNPTLLEFVAENPVRHDGLPPNIVDVARVILEAGARQDAAALSSTLSLVCSGRVAREAGLQCELIDLLCDYGASPSDAMRAALGHGEFDAVSALMRRGASTDLTSAAALGRLDEARRLLPASQAAERHLALAWAAQFGHAGIVGMLLDVGEAPDRYNPPGAHSHSTPLHQAAWAGHCDVVSLLVDRGAALDMKDVLYQATPREWAEHAGHEAIAGFLREHERRSR